jgi:hypothetical protein
MSRVVRWQWAGLGLATLVAGAFGYLNSRELVAVNVGFTVLYQVRLVWLVFVSFLLGMLTMFLLGLRNDMKVRRLLREREHRSPPAFRPLTSYAPPDTEP